MTVRLLILRPEPGAGATLTAAAALGMDAVRYPLFAVVALPWSGPEPRLIDALMFTSANGARLGGDQLRRYRHLPAYAVGDATAAAVRKAGFADVRVGDDGVQALALMMAAKGVGQVLHISGRDVRTFDPGPLRVASACVYAAVETGNAEELGRHFSPDRVALLHSARAARRLAELLPARERAGRRILAISDAALEDAGTGWASAIASPRPTGNAMLALAASLCE